MESLSKDDRFRVLMTEYENGYGQRPEVSEEFNSFLAAYKLFLATNAKLGVGTTPDNYVRADCIQWYNQRLNNWTEITMKDYHEFGSMYLMDCMQKGMDYGFVEYRKERDKWQKDVTIVNMPDGTKYRLVHNSKELSVHYQQFAILYRKAGVFLRYFYSHPSSDRALKTVKLGGYEMSWGDGEPGWYIIPEGYPDLRDKFSKLYGEDTEAFVLIVLSALHDREDLWEVKKRTKESR